MTYQTQRDRLQPSLTSQTWILDLAGDPHGEGERRGGSQRCSCLGISDDDAWTLGGPSSLPEYVSTVDDGGSDGASPPAVGAAGPERMARS